MSIDALSLACNIITLIDFSHKFYETCRKIHDDGKPDPDAENEARELYSLSARLQQSRKTTGQAVTDNDQLLRVADQCVEATRTFQSEIEKLAPSTSSSRIGQGWQVLSSATKRTWRQAQIEKLHKTMQDCQQTMQTAVLVDIHRSGLADQAVRREEFERLDTRLKSFCLAVSQAKFGISDLLARNQALHEETRTFVQKELEAMNNAQRNLEDQKRLRNSLKFPGINQRHNEIKVAHPDTFRWLFGKPVRESEEDYPYFIRHSSTQTFGDFDQWLKSENPGLYWVSGKPGAGKSTLMKFLYDELHNGSSHLVLGHYFWLGPSNTRSRQNDLEGMFSTLLYQLVGEDADSSESLVASLLQQTPGLRQKDAHTDWSLMELQDTTLAALRLLNKRPTIYILIDALDEHLPSDDHGDLLSSIWRLGEIPNARLIVSSRRERIFEKALTHTRQLRLEKLTPRDIYHYALDTLRRNAELDSIGHLSVDLLTDIAGMITKKAEGVFFWARLAVESVRRGLIDENSEDVLRERLRAMPTKLEEYFNSIWQRLGDDIATYRTKAANIFSLLLCDAATLGHIYQDRYGDPDGTTPTILGVTLALNPETALSVIKDTNGTPDLRLLQMCQRTEKTVMSHCAGLIEYQPQPGPAACRPCPHFDHKYPDPRKTCRLIHRTAVDFFRETPKGKAIVGFNDIGQDGPNFRMMLALLAEAIAFRKPPHEAMECSQLMQVINFKEWLRPLLFEHKIGSSLTTKQRHLLVSRCHDVYYQFCAPLENPGFADWEITIGRTFSYPFVAFLAFEGFDEYVEAWVEEKSRNNRLPTAEACTALLLGNLWGHSKRIKDSLDWEDGKFNTRASAFQNSIFWKSQRALPHSLSDVQEVLGPINDLNLRLPVECIFDSHILNSMISSSEMLFELAEALIAAYARFKSSPPASNSILAPSIASMILQLLSIFTTHKHRLSDNITCHYEIPDGKRLPIGTAGLRVLLESHRHKGDGILYTDDCSRLEVCFETTPLWLIQWLAQAEMCHRPQHEMAHGIAGLLQSVIEERPKTQAPRLISLITRTITRNPVTNSHTMREEIRCPLTDGAAYMLEPLMSSLKDEEQWKNIGAVLRERFEEAWDEARVPERSAEDYDHSQSYHRDLLRLAAACDVRMRHDDNGNWDEWDYKPFVIPGKGASKEDKAFSKLIMYGFIKTWNI